MEPTTSTYAFPSDRRYDPANHTWVSLAEDSGHARVGVHALGLDALGELAYLSLAPVGTSVQRGDPIGTLEAAKMTTDLVAPVSGTIVARNEDALRQPYLVNQDPYGRGWLVAIAPSDWDNDVSSLLSAEEMYAWAQEHEAQEAGALEVGA